MNLGGTHIQSTAHIEGSARWAPVISAQSRERASQGPGTQHILLRPESGAVKNRTGLCRDSPMTPTKCPLTHQSGDSKLIISSARHNNMFIMENN